MASYVAFLRGINVGGKNPVPMATLKSCVEKSGYGNVATYIQSGNVLFDAPRRPSRAALTADLEAILEHTFGTPLAVVVRSHREMAAIVADRPKDFGAKPQDYRYDVVFLKEPLTPKAAMKEITTKEGVDRIWAGKGVLYFSRLNARATQSRLNKVAALPAYRSMTIRNWNTTTKVLAMLEERSGN